MASLFGAVLVLEWVGCRTAPTGRASAPPPLPPRADTASLSLEDTLAGRALYINKCARCHKFYDPANYSAKDWAKWMAKMSRKSKLKPTEQELLVRYLDLYRPSSASGKLPDSPAKL